MDISETISPREVIKLISESSEVEEDNADGYPVSYIIMFQALCSPQPCTLDAACQWLGASIQEHLQVDGAAPGGINEIFCNLILTINLLKLQEAEVWSQRRLSHQCSILILILM